jgi:hypothetical protein
VAPRVRRQFRAVRKVVDTRSPPTVADEDGRSPADDFGKKDRLTSVQTNRTRSSEPVNVSEFDETVFLVGTACTSTTTAPGTAVRAATRTSARRS